jgi:hypothetical protein
MRGMGLGFVAALVGCTARTTPQAAAQVSDEPAPIVAADPDDPPPALPPAGVPIVHGTPRPSELGRLIDVRPLGSYWTLLRYADEEGHVLAFATGPGRHVWSTRLPPGFDEMTVVGLMIVGAMERYTGAVGLDLESGERRWRTIDDALKGGAGMGQHVRAEPGEGQVLHLLRSHTTFSGHPQPASMLAFRIHDGKLLGAAGGNVERAAVTARWVAHRQYEFTVGGDPDQPEYEYLLRSRDDLAVARPLGALSDACILGDRLYATSARGLLRVDLTDPALAEHRLPVTLPGMARMNRCDNYAFSPEEVLWVQGKLIGGGMETWELDLGGLQADLDRPHGDWWADGGPALPVRAAMLARRDDAVSLVLVDLPGRRARELALSAWSGGRLVHDEHRSVLLLTTKHTAALLSIDGRTSRVTAAVRIEGSNHRSLRVAPVTDASVWLYDEHAWAARGDRHPDMRTLLDATTLRPVGEVSAFTLFDVTEWAQAWLDAATDIVAPAPVSKLPSLPARPLPGRASGPAPAWDLAELFAAVSTQGAGKLLAWDRQEEASGDWSEHALVVVEQTGEDRRPLWTIALMRRGNKTAWEPWWDMPNLDEEATPRTQAKIAWTPMYSPPRHEPRTLHLRRQPTAADLRRFLAGSGPWDPAGNLLAGDRWVPPSRAWIVDGNVIDAAWRALTGEAPDWSYPPEVERPD